MKKLYLLILIPLLLLTTIIVLDKDVYAVNTYNPIDDVIVATVEYNNGFVSLSPDINTVVNDIDYNGVFTRVLYTAFFDKDVSFRISSGSSTKYFYNVRFVAIVFDYYVEVPDFLAFVSLYDVNSDIINTDFPNDTTFVALDYSFNAWQYNIQLTYDDGYNDGLDHGYNDGYNDGLDDGYNDGYDYGEAVGYSDGYDDSKEQYGYYDKGEYYTGNYAYNKGFNEGADTNIKADIINFVPGVLGAIFMFFFQISQIGILGITILDVLGLLVLISALIFVIKFFF